MAALCLTTLKRSDSHPHKVNWQIIITGFLEFLSVVWFMHYDSVYSIINFVKIVIHYKMFFSADYTFRDSN